MQIHHKSIKREWKEYSLFPPLPFNHIGHLHNSPDAAY